ncbi:MAG: hypothetical protein ACOC2U_01995 [bacterium]
MKTIKYNPHKRGFPFKTLKLLYEQGACEEWLIREEIGLEDWVAKKGLIYYQRSKIIFNNLVLGLKEKGLITQEGDVYQLTDLGINFMKKYEKV